MMKRKLAWLLVIALLIISLAGCAASAKEDVAMDYAPSQSTGTTNSFYSDAKGESYDSGWVDEEDAIAEDDSADLSDSLASMTIESALASNRKIILSADINMETTEFADSIAALRNAVESLGGYISASETYVYNATYELRSAHYTVRIPAENFSAFIAKSEDMGNVTNANIWQDDVTHAYTDIEARLATLETKRERLLALLDEATEMADIIELEGALSQTIYEIETLTGQRNVYDDKIAYSTARLYIDEVRKMSDIMPPPKTLGERVAQTFRSSWEDFAEFCEDALVWFVGALPVFVVLIVIAAVVLIVFRITAPKRKARQAVRAQETAEALARWNATKGAPQTVAERKIEEKSDK